MIYIGLDPGSSSFGWAWGNPDHGHVKAGSFRPKDLADAAWRLKEILPKFDRALVTIECQESRRGNERADPNNILTLQLYSGIAAAVAALAGNHVEILTPTPMEWKGQIAKKIHTPILLKEFKKFGGKEIDGPKGGVPDALDAFGLLVWGWKQKTLLEKYQ